MKKFKTLLSVVFFSLLLLPFLAQADSAALPFGSNQNETLYVVSVDTLGTETDLSAPATDTMEGDVLLGEVEEDYLYISNLPVRDPAAFEGVALNVYGTTTDGLADLEYYNGTDWTTLENNISTFKNSPDGSLLYTWDIPSDWATFSGDFLTAYQSAYTVRFHITEAFDGQVLLTSVGLVIHDLTVTVEDEFGTPLDVDGAIEDALTFDTASILISETTGVGEYRTGTDASYTTGSYIYTMTMDGYVEQTGGVDLLPVVDNTTLDLVMPYAYLVTVEDSDGNLISDATVEAGDSYSVLCALVAEGTYACPVSASETTGNLRVTTSTYGVYDTTFSTIRSAQDDAQVLETVVLSSSALPDLEVTNVEFIEDYMSPGEYRVSADFTNVGSDDVDPSTYSGVNSVDVNGVRDSSYSWSTLSDTDFLTVGGTTTLDVIASPIAFADGDIVEVCVDGNEVVTETDESNNCFTATFVAAVTGIDLTVTSVSLNSDNSIEYVVSNLGTDDADTTLDGSNTMMVDGSLIGTNRWGTLGDTSFLLAGQSTTILGINLDAGIQTVEVCVDTTDLVVEADETNNCFTQEFTVTDTTGPDLTVTDIRVGSGNQIEYDVTNQGTEDIDSSTTGLQTISVDGATVAAYNWSTLADTSFLAAGVSTTLYASAPTAGAHSIEICLDTSDLVVESDETNNCLTLDLTFEELPTGDDDDDDSTDTLLPDLVIDSVTLNSDNTVHFVVSNDGTVDLTSDQIVTLSFYDQTSGDGSANESFTLNDLGSSYQTVGGSISFDSTYVLPTLPATVLAVVDPANEIEEVSDGIEESNYYRTVLGDSSTGDDDDDDSNGGGGSGGHNSLPSHNNPDLAVDDIYLQTDGDVIAVLINDGEADVSSKTRVRVQVSVDGETVWTQDYNQDDDKDFLDEGGESDINAGELLDEEDETYEIEICVDTEEAVDELRETNNCRTENLSIKEDGVNQEVTLSSEDADACDDYFYDTDGHWAEGEICNLYNREVVVGRKRHYYVPNDSVTRAEFVKIALLNYGLDVEAVRSGDDFSDVDSNDWFYDYVTFARDLGIIEDENGKFRPDDDITRGEAMAILVRLELDGSELDDLLDSDIDDSDIDFSDVDDRDWVAPYIVYGQDENLIEGYSNGTFRPDNYISRAEAAEIAYNLYRNRY